jgi:BolA protein
MTLTRKQRMEAALKQKFAPDQLQVRDDSHRHAGHAGWNAAGETHMHIQIVSAAFVGQTRLARHRMVNEALAPFFTEGLHALSIDANAPEAK